MIRERLMHFIDIQAAVADELTGEQQHGNLVSEARERPWVAVDIDHIEGEALRFGQRGELGQEFLAQAATRARIQHEAHL